MTKAVKFISGEKVFLRALTREDLAGPMLQWSDDDEVTRYMFRGWRPSRIDELEAAYDKTVNNPNEIEFAVCCQKSGKHVGIAGLHDISWIPRSAEFRIMIGDKSMWGKGYGSETARLLLQYGFEKLNLHRLWLGVNAEDARAVKSYVNAGFQHEGVLRDVVYRNGRYYDAIRMSCLRTDRPAEQK